MGVRLRVTLAAAGLFAVALTIASFVLVNTVHDNLADEIASTNQEQLDAIAAQVERGTDPGNIDVPDNGNGQPRVTVRGQGRDAVPAVPGQNRPPLRPDDPRVRAQRTIETAKGTVTLVAEQSLAEVDSTVESITGALYIGVPALVLLVGALTWWLTGRALRPVEAIRAEAAAITGSTMHRRVPEPGTDDEVGRLARTMNSMLERLEDASSRQRRFVSDASHELRSPVASIRAQLEVALRRGPAADWPTVAARVLDEDERLEQAVDELLELARTQEDDAGETVELDLDDIVLEETARARRVPIDTSQVLAGRVIGNERQLARVVRNLLDNACRHAASKVAITLGERDGSVRLVVDDDGPGIPPADRARVFDRFTRLDEGRARDAGGVGLGLSMVKAIVERHGGSVVVDDAPLGGARFVVQLRHRSESERAESGSTGRRPRLRRA